MDLAVPDGWYASDDDPLVKSPDRRASWTRTPTFLLAAGQTAESQEGWLFKVDSRFTKWRALFSAATLPALVELFHAAFTDLEPLPRDPHLLDAWQGSEVTVTQPLSFAHSPVSARHFSPAPPRSSNAAPRSNPSAQACHRSR